MAKHNKGSGGRNYLTGRRKMKQDLWNQLDLAPAGLFMWSNERFCYSSLAATFSRTGENLTNNQLGHKLIGKWIQWHPALTNSVITKTPF